MSDLCQTFEDFADLLDQTGIQITTLTCGYTPGSEITLDIGFPSNTSWSYHTMMNTRRILGQDLAEKLQTLAEAAGSAFCMKITPDHIAYLDASHHLLQHRQHPKLQTTYTVDAELFTHISKKLTLHTPYHVLLNEPWTAHEKLALSPYIVLSTPYFDRLLRGMIQEAPCRVWANPHGMMVYREGNILKVLGPKVPLCFCPQETDHAKRDVADRRDPYALGAA